MQICTYDACNNSNVHRIDDRFLCSAHAVRALVKRLRFIDVAVSLPRASSETLDALITDYVGSFHYVGLWDQPKDKNNIHDFLGLHVDDYKAWVKDPSCLFDIVNRYRCR